jgi:DNA-binding NarL/FixJ family response regulator
MPAMSGLDAIVSIKGLSTATSIIMLTSSELDEDIRLAMKRGAAGYLLKSLSPHDIVRAILSVQGGGLPLDPSITRMMMNKFVGWEDQRNKGYQK